MPTRYISSNTHMEHNALSVSTQYDTTQSWQQRKKILTIYPAASKNWFNIASMHLPVSSLSNEILILVSQSKKLRKKYDAALRISTPRRPQDMVQRGLLPSSGSLRIHLPGNHLHSHQCVPTHNMKRSSLMRSLWRLRALTTDLPDSVAEGQRPVISNNKKKKWLSE